MSGHRARLTVVGCSGSFARPDSPASCYLVEVPRPDGGTLRVLLDLGSGALGPLQRLVEVHDLDAVLLSHLHPDHFLDLCGLYVALKYDPVHSRPEPLPVYGPTGTFERLRQAYGSDGTHLQEVFQVREWADGCDVDLGPATVTPVRVNHTVETYGLRLQVPAGEVPVGEVPAGGRPGRGAVLAYTGDTDSCPALRDLARDADLLLAEASFQEGRDTVRGVHLTGLRAGQAAADAGAGRLVLTHLPVWNDPQIVLAEARTSFDGEVEVAAQGRRYDL